MQPSDSCVATSGWFPFMPDDEWPVVVVMFILGYFTCKLFTLSGKVPVRPPRPNNVMDPTSKLLGRTSIPGRKDITCSHASGKQEPVILSDDEDGDGILNEACTAAKMGQPVYASMSPTCGRVHGHQDDCASAGLPARLRAAAQK
mmetsp:Transcript_128348/g.256355  ORF Transcript_128348/g.256355 Transcript_128348/m.256355 type:complete len:145 (-) Transcript_128348:153-587(-)